MTPTPWFRVVTGARGDIFNFNVSNNLVDVSNQPSGSQTKAIPSAKLNMIFGPWYETELFANFGTGFHSNDARAVVQDPHLRALAQATGWEFGVRTKILPNVEASFTYWWLNLTSELVFNGDTATLEPEGASHRNGFEFMLKATPFEWLTFTGNVTNTPVAEFFNGAAIPLAPRLTAFTDVTARLPWGFSANSSVRFVGPRYADEARTQTARGYTIVDLGVRYRYNLPGATRAGRVPVDREPVQRDVAGSTVLLHLSPARRAGPGRERHPLHAGQPPHVPGRPGFPVLIPHAERGEAAHQSLAPPPTFTPARRSSTLITAVPSSLLRPAARAIW